MATGDVFENEMRIVDAVDYVRGMKGESSVLIDKSNIYPFLGKWSLVFNSIGWYRVFSASKSTMISFVANITKEWYSGYPESSLIYANVFFNSNLSRLKQLGGRAEYITKCRAVFDGDMTYFDIYSAKDSNNPITIYYNFLNNKPTFIGEKINTEYTDILEVNL